MAIFRFSTAWFFVYLVTSLIAPTGASAESLYQNLKRDYKVRTPKDFGQIKCEPGDFACDELKYKLAITYNLLYPVDSIAPEFFDYHEAPPAGCYQIRSGLGSAEKAHWTCTFFGLREAMKYELSNLSTARCTGAANGEQIQDFWKKTAAQCPSKRIDLFFECMNAHAGDAPSTQVSNSVGEIAKLAKEMTRFQDACRATQLTIPPIGAQNYCRSDEFLLFQDAVTSFEWMQPRGDVLSTWQPGFDPQHAPQYFYFLDHCEEVKKKFKYAAYPFEKPKMPEKDKAACPPELGAPADKPVLQMVRMSMDASQLASAGAPAKGPRGEGTTEPEFQLEEDKGVEKPKAQAVVEAKPKPDLKREQAEKKKEQQERKLEQVKKEAEHQKLLEEVKKDFLHPATEAVIAEKKPSPAVLPPQVIRTQSHSDEQKKLNARFQSVVANAERDVKNGQNKMVPEMADMGELMLLSEVEDLKLTDEQKKKEAERLTAKWRDAVGRYKEFYRSTEGLPFEERLAKLMTKANLEFTRRYVDRKEEPNAIFMRQCLDDNQYCNCVGNTKLNTFLSMAVLAGEKVPEHKQLLIQNLGYHVAAVLYDTKEKSTWDLLAGGARTTDLKGEFYHPAEELNAELERKGGGATDPKKLLVLTGRLEATEEEKKAEHARTASDHSKPKDSKPQFSDGLPRLKMSGLIDPDPNGNKKTENQISASYVNKLERPSAHPSEEVDLDRAQADLRKILSSAMFKELISLKSQPQLLLDGNYNLEKIKKLKVLQEEIIKILDGSAYVNSSSDDAKAMARIRIEEVLGKKNPELLTLFNVYKNERGHDYDKKITEVEKAARIQKNLKLFQLLGPSKWILYRELSKLPRSSETPFVSAVSEVVDNTASMFGTDYTIDLDSYFRNAEKIGFAAQYKKGAEPPSEKTDPHLKVDSKKTSRQNLRQPTLGEKPAGETALKDEGKIVPMTGLGNEETGLTQKPLPKAQFELTPLQYAGYIAQANIYNTLENPVVAWSAVVTRKWTPTLTAALRAKKEYDADFVKWFTGVGFRTVADSRDSATLLISGPDKKPVPKDVAALLVDFLENKDLTGGDRTELLSMIAKNYGNPSKYIERVKAEFTNQEKKPADPAAPSKDQFNSNFELFKKFAKDQGIDEKILDKANKRSFEFKAIPAQTAIRGDYPSTSPYRVELTKPYEIQLTPVTQLQWFLVMNTLKGAVSDDTKNPTQHIDSYQSDYRALSDRDGTTLNINHPVSKVSWDDAQAYIDRLNQFAGKDKKCRYRLPTESEWEVASRAAPKKAGRVFVDEPNAPYARADKYTHEVAQQPPNSGGIYDMDGNVSQWVSDWNGSDFTSPGTLQDYTGPSTGDQKVVRGKGFDPNRIMKADGYENRSFMHPTSKYIFVGFRLVRECH